MRRALADAGRALRRPWPWVLRYGLTTLPAACLGPLIALPLRSWFRAPLLSEALETRSLEKLVEFALHVPDGAFPAGWVVVALLLAPIAWVIVQLAGLWVEGGILATYAHPTPPSWRDFLSISTRALGRFALQAAIGIALTLVLVAITVVVALVGRTLWPAILPLATALGVVAVGAVWVWIRLARACVVVRDEGKVLRALRQAWRTLCRYPLPVLALVVGVLALRALLVYASVALVAWMPLRWWLLTLFIQQAAQLLTVGAGLVRRIGEVRLVQASTSKPET